MNQNKPSIEDLQTRLEQLEEENSRLKKSNDEILSGINWEGKVILIAEDEEYNYKIIYEYLKETGASLIHVKNGKEAVKIIQDGTRVDLVLMDIRMPVMNGLMAAKKIRQIDNKQAFF